MNSVMGSRATYGPVQLNCSLLRFLRLRARSRKSPMWICGWFSGCLFLLFVIRMLFFLLFTRVLTSVRRSRSLFVQVLNRSAEITDVFTSSKLWPEKASRSAADFGLRPVNTSIGDMLSRDLDSVVLRLYCTRGTISGQRFRFQEGPDLLRTVRKISKHSRLCRSIMSFAHGE